MDDTPLQFTKRELQRMAHAPRFWAVILSVALILGLTGPFGTYEGLRLIPRIVYWLGISVVTYFVALGTVLFLVRQFGRHETAGPESYALAGAFAGVPVFLVVALVNAQIFPGDLEGLLPHLTLLAYCVVISATVSTIVKLLIPKQVAAIPAQAPAQPPSRRPRLLDRLALESRGRILYLSMQDHYVAVHTENGCSLVLMRFADAIAEAEGEEGLQIHRSHWVAQAAIKGQLRKEGRLHLEMQDGELLPVSRSFLPAVREMLARR